MPLVCRDFTNRDDELKKFRELFTAESFDRDSVVLLYGQEGIGKTQLLARYLRECNFNSISIAYVDLAGLDYLGLIDRIINGLGKSGFEHFDAELDRVLDRLLGQSKLLADKAQTHVQSEQAARMVETAKGVVFNQSVSAEYQLFVGGNANFNDAKITQIFNFQLDEPINVQDQNRKDITQAFYDCLRAIAKERPFVILLDHWEKVNDDLKGWFEQHFVIQPAELVLNKAQVILAHEDFPTIYANKMGIKTLPVPPFDREAALKFWMKCGLPADAFDTLTPERYGIPAFLMMEVDKYQLRHKLSKEIG